MPITALPTPPSRADATNFSSRADAFFAALPQFVTEMNANIPTALGGTVTGAFSVSQNTTLGSSSSNTLTIQAGSAALPALIPAGDPNTGLWFPAADTVAISTGGAEAMRINSSRHLLVGTTSPGTMSATALARVGDMAMMSKTVAGVANNGTVDIAIETAGAGFQGVLIVAVTAPSNANIRTQAVYAILGRGTTLTATSIAAANGSVSGASFTLTAPSNGVIRVTNTSGATCDVYLQFIGGVSY